MERLVIEIVDGVLCNNGRILFVAKDGTETDISSVVSGFEIRGNVGAVNRVSLECIKVEIVPKGERA